MSSKKIISEKFANAIFAITLILSPLSAVTFNASGNIILGGSPTERITETTTDKKTKKTEYDSKNQFGGAYLKGDFTLSNDKLTAAGKIYYRLNASDSRDDESQRIDINRAYLRYRPFGTNLLEFSIGKKYSYYLSGNYFQLAEVYTGATRWGETGIGAKFEYKGFSLGSGFQMAESYTKFSDYYGLAGAAGYDFSNLTENLPLKFGADLVFTRTGPDYSKSDDIEDKADYDFSGAFSLYYTPKLEGFFSKPALTLTYSYNTKPFVCNTAYKHVANYSNSDLKKSNFASLNWRNYFGPVQFLAEGEAGYSVEGDMIPLYAGAQLLIPIYKKIVYFKPRFFYYAALDTENSDNSRHSYEFYPRAWIVKGKWTVSAGADIIHKEYEKDYWRWEWEIPMYIEYKIGK